MQYKISKSQGDFGLLYFVLPWTTLTFGREEEFSARRYHLCDNRRCSCIAIPTILENWIVERNVERRRCYCSTCFIYTLAERKKANKRIARLI